MYFLIHTKLRVTYSDLANISINYHQMHILYFLGLLFTSNYYSIPGYDFMSNYIWGNANVFSTFMVMPTDKPRGVAYNIGGELQNI